MDDSRRSRSAARFGMTRLRKRPVLELASEEILDCLLHHFATSVGNGCGKRYIFGTDLHAVLRKTAFLDAAIAHERPQAFVLESLTRGMLIEQADLGDGGGAYKSGLLVELRTGFHAAATGDAA